MQVLVSPKNLRLWDSSIAPFKIQRVQANICPKTHPEINVSELDICHEFCNTWVRHHV